MGQLTRWLRATRCLLRLARARGTLAGAALLMLTLGVAGLLLPMLAVSPAPVRAAAVVSPLKGHPTRTPRPTRTLTATAAPSPTPTAPGTVGPTAVPTAAPTPAAPTAAATGTGSPGVGGQDGSRDSSTQAGAALLGWLAGWGLGAVIAGALGLAVCLALLKRVTARDSRWAAFGSPAHRTTPARLNQLHHLLPARQAAPPLGAGEAGEPPLEEDDEWQPLPSAQEPPPSAPLKPPRWMIEAGLLKGETGELPAEQPPEP